MKKLKLAPHLVPKPLWGHSAYQLLDKPTLKAVTIGNQQVRVKRPTAWSRPSWERIRQDARFAAGNKCSICGASKGALHCHEVWSYDDATKTAMLTGLVSICGACHAVIHLGRTGTVGKREEALEHLSRVNRISRVQAEALSSDALALWRQRNRIAWRVRVAPELLEKYPELGKLQT